MQGRKDDASAAVTKAAPPASSAPPALAPGAHTSHGEGCKAAGEHLRQKPLKMPAPNLIEGDS